MGPLSPAPGVVQDETESLQRHNREQESEEPFRARRVRKIPRPTIQLLEAGLIIDSGEWTVAGPPNPAPSAEATRTPSASYTYEVVSTRRTDYRPANSC